MEYAYDSRLRDRLSDALKNDHFIKALRSGIKESWIRDEYASKRQACLVIGVVSLFALVATGTASAMDPRLRGLTITSAVMLAVTCIFAIGAAYGVGDNLISSKLDYVDRMEYRGGDAWFASRAENI